MKKWEKWVNNCLNVIIVLLFLICLLMTIDTGKRLHQLKVDLGEVKESIEEVKKKQAETQIQLDEYFENQVKSTSQKYTVTQEELKALAIIAQGEASVINSRARRAAVIWCALNRVDDGYGSIIMVVTAPNAFAYDPNLEPEPYYLELAKDVTDRWIEEKAGAENVGRVLPPTYKYFMGDGENNHFTKVWGGTDYWDWSLPNPYSS